MQCGENERWPNCVSDTMFSLPFMIGRLIIGRENGVLLREVYVR